MQLGSVHDALGKIIVGDLLHAEDFGRGEKESRWTVYFRCSAMQNRHWSELRDHFLLLQLILAAW